MPQQQTFPSPLLTENLSSTERTLQPPTRQAPRLSEKEGLQKEPAPSQPHKDSSKGYSKAPYIVGGTAVIAAGVALAWAGLTLWQKRVIASVLSQYKLKPKDLTQRQRNLLAATFNARYNPWALNAYAGKYDESAALFNFPHAWQILQQLYFVRKPTRAKIAQFRKDLFRK